MEPKIDTSTTNEAVAEGIQNILDQGSGARRNKFERLFGKGEGPTVLYFEKLQLLHVRHYERKLLEITTCSTPPAADNLHEALHKYSQ